MLPALRDILRGSEQTIKGEMISIIHIWWKVRGSSRDLDDCFGSFASRLHCQTTGQPTGKSPPRLDNYLSKLEEISRTRNPILASTQMAHFRKSKSFRSEIWESDSRRETRHIPIPPVSGSWKLGSRPLSRNLETFSMFLCCTCSINFFRFA